MTGKVHKFIIVPICTIYDEEGRVIEEQRMKAITHYAANLIDLKVTAQRLEDTANAKFFSKVTAPQGK